MAFSAFRIHLFFLLSIFLLIITEKGALAQIRLDHPQRLIRGKIAGIANISKAADSIQMRTSSSPWPPASLFIPLEPDFDTQRNNLFEVTMRTGPRIHNFLFVWTQAESGVSYSIKQMTYHDGELHTYLIPLLDYPLWRERIAEAGLVWLGTQEAIEIKKMELRPIGIKDGIRYQWSRFWFPEIVNPATINAIGGPILLGQPLALILTFLFSVVLFLKYLSDRYVGFLKRDTSASNLHSHPRIRLQAVFWSFLTLWVAYDLRESYNHLQTLKPEFRFYLFTSERPRHYLNLDDFYDFLDFVEKVVPPSKSLGFYSGRLPFVKARYFLFPRRVFDRTPNLDYIVVFQDPDVFFHDGILMQKSVVMDNRLKLVGQFGEDAFVLVRNND